MMFHMRVSDAHNHLQNWGDYREIQSMLAKFPENRLALSCVNGTKPSDWGAVAELAKTFPQIHPFFGLHPWELDHATHGWIDLLGQYLQQFPNSGVGECGVDLWINNAEPSRQKAHLIPQIRLAKELERPLTIHCLKAWQLLIECFECEPPPQHGFLLHGFGGSAEVAKRFTHLGAYFSFNSSFMQSRKTKVREAFQKIPLNRILTETDAPAMTPPSDYWHIEGDTSRDRNHPYNLIETNKALAKVLAINESELCKILEQNLSAFLGCEQPR